MKRVLYLLLCLCMIVSSAVMPAGAASAVTMVNVLVTAPAEGFQPTAPTTKSTASSKVADFEWTGELDANGCFIGGKEYTLTVTVKMKDGIDKYFKQSSNAGNYTIGGKTAKVAEHTYTKVVLSYTFTAAASLNLTAVKLNVTEPIMGRKPADATLESDQQGRKITKTEWIGALDNGAFKAGVPYVVRCTVVPSMDSATMKVTKDSNVTFNGLEGNIVSSAADQVVVEYKFAPTAPKVAAVSDDGVLRVADFYYNEPAVGDKPPTHISVSQSDALYVSNIEWSGDFDENGRFKADKSYSLNFQVNVRDGVNLTIPSGSNEKQRNYRLNGSFLSVDLGANDAKTKRVFHKNVSVAIPRSVVDVSELYTMEEADKLENTRNARDLIVNTAWVDKQIEKYGEFYFDFLRVHTRSPIEEALSVNADNGNPEVIYATRFLIDEPRDDAQTASGGSWFGNYPLVEEIWFSPDMNAERFVNNFSFSSMFSPPGRGVNSWECTIYLPASKYPNGLLSELSYSYGFRTLLYDGDVYEAFERAGRGEKVGREWCPGHKFTLRRRSAEHVAAYPTCTTPFKYYYSCEFCGQPEYNDKHTFMASYTEIVSTAIAGRIEHKFSEVIDDKHLIGKNAEGDLVYAQTCDYCGLDKTQITRGEDLTEAIYKREINLDEMSYKQYVQHLKDNWEKNGKRFALESTLKYPKADYFVVKGGKEVTAKLSSWSVNSVQWAAQEDLLDMSLLGGDYTKTINRLQFCSIAVKLAENLTGIEITPAAAGTFSNSDNVYVRKAYAAGITSGTGNGTFSPNATLTREQMATFMNNVFKYVVNNSGIRYSAYDSKLASYTDSNKISSWAREPMAKMNAYGLINGTGATTLAPTNNCTIEQAIVVARSGLRAHEVGWYQATGWDSYYYWPDTSAAMYTGVGYYNGDRVWVCAAPTGGMDDDAWLPVESPSPDRTGTRLYARSEHFKPIRELLAGDAELYHKYVPEA